jgi:GrpB-like predicted nucleotidyltransferase (UPF0157 family)
MDYNKDLAVKIVEYDNESPLIFTNIKQFLFKIIPYKIEIEHIGSTAVPGLGGKGIIDILIVTEKDFMKKTVESLVSEGYNFNPEVSTNPDKPFVSGSYKYNDKNLHIHIHITFKGSNENKDLISFRDYLRKNPAEAKKYFKLKKKWSLEAGSDRLKYTELKTSYINEVLEKAKGETSSSGLKD